MKLRQLFENHLTDHDEIKAWLDKMNIKNYEIDPSGRVVVDGDVNLEGGYLATIPVKFKAVSGDFYCRHINLTSLVGSPRETGGGFYCDSNLLSSLDGAPREVGGHFICSHNKLTTLQGAPRSVGGHFYCSYNKLETLQGAPSYVEGDFSCIYNLLTSLDLPPNTRIRGDMYVDSGVDTQLPPSVTVDRVWES